MDAFPHGTKCKSQMQQRLNNKLLLLRIPQWFPSRYFHRSTTQLSKRRANRHSVLGEVRSISSRCLSPTEVSRSFTHHISVISRPGAVPCNYKNRLPLQTYQTLPDLHSAWFLHSLMPGLWSYIQISVLIYQWRQHHGDPSSSTIRA